MATPYDNAFTMLQSLLNQWGLSELLGDVRNMLIAGDREDVIPLKLRETDAYKRRFAGNQARIRAGLPALSEAEYLSTEASLRSVVQRYVGSGVYDAQSNLERWIGANVSPQTLNDRFIRYQDNYLKWGQQERDAWAARGLTPSDAIAALGDPNITESALERRARIYSLGAASVQAYRDSRALNQDELGRFADAGVSDDQAQRGFRDVAGREDYESFLARSAGQQLTRQDQENAAILGDQQAEQKRRRVLATDQARFEGNYLGTTNALRRNVAGSY